MVRNPGRLLAPIAIAAVAVGACLIVEANVGTRHPTVMHTTADHVSPARSVSARPGSRRARFYRVRVGDTLSEIATRTGVSLTRLEALNPSLAPAYELHAGQRLRLRR